MDEINHSYPGNVYDNGRVLQMIKENFVDETDV